MRLFCSYAFTGEDESVVRERMSLVVDTLRSGGHEPYCNFFDYAFMEIVDSDDALAIFQSAFTHLKESEGVVAVVTTGRTSTGMLLELGAALSRRTPVYLFIQNDALEGSYLPRLAAATFNWSDLSGLQHALERFCRQYGPHGEAV